MVRSEPARTPADQATLAMALPIVKRLRDTVAAENEDIAKGRRVAYETYSLRKNQALLELNRLASALGGAVAGGALGEALADLVATLEVNRQALGVQLKARPR